jgi:hypothetical protein
MNGQAWDGRNLIAGIKLVLQDALNHSQACERPLLVEREDQARVASPSTGR